MDAVKQRKIKFEIAVSSDECEKDARGDPESSVYSERWRDWMSLQLCRSGQQLMIRTKEIGYDDVELN